MTTIPATVPLASAPGHPLPPATPIQDRVASLFPYDNIRVPTIYPDMHGVMWHHVGPCIQFAFVWADHSTRDDELLARLRGEPEVLGCRRNGIVHAYGWDDDEPDFYALGPADDLVDAAEMLLRERRYLA